MQLMKMFNNFHDSRVERCRDFDKNILPLPFLFVYIRGILSGDGDFVLQ